MPYVRNVVAQWQPRNCIPMVDFLDSWGHIIPVWILDNILDQLICPKLQKEVDEGLLGLLSGTLGIEVSAGLVAWGRRLNQKALVAKAAWCRG